MGREKRAKQQQEPRRSRFEPKTIGVITGVKLALWMLQKSHGIVEHHIEVNNLTKAKPLAPATDNESTGSRRLIVDDRDPEIGYMVTRLTITAFSMELLLKRIGNSKG